jgi:hypothetical protein
MRYGNNARRPDDQFYREALQTTRELLQIPKVTPISLHRLVDHDLDILQSSPGLPWCLMTDEDNNRMFRTRGDVMRDAAAWDSILRMNQRIRSGASVNLPPCQGFCRAQMVKNHDETKVRAVWAYPSTVSFLEQCFVLPLIEAYKNVETPYALWCNVSAGSMVDIFNDTRHLNGFVGIDFKGFDKSVPAFLIRDAFDILASNLNLTQGDRRVYNQLCDYFINTKIALSNGELWLKTSGVATGSGFTNIIDSIVNHIVLTWSSLRYYRHTPDYMIVYGDDSITGFDTYQKADGFLRAVTETAEFIGMEVNRQKSDLSSIFSIQFLGYKVLSGLVWRDTDLLYSMLHWPEHRDTSYDDVRQRAYGLAYASLGVSPFFWDDCMAIIGNSSIEITRRDVIRMLKYTVGATTKLPNRSDLFRRSHLW